LSNDEAARIEALKVMVELKRNGGIIWKGRTLQVLDCDRLVWKIPFDERHRSQN
jgi:hypothetical protein